LAGDLGGFVASHRLASDFPQALEGQNWVRVAPRRAHSSLQNQVITATVVESEFLSSRSSVSYLTFRVALATLPPNFECIARYAPDCSGV
jgi:hypothetical protein